jgi:hypothetical protein
MKEKTLLEKLNKLPAKISWNGVDYSLFIYKKDGFWGVAYARGKYFCDEPNRIDIDGENIIITDVSDNFLENAVDIISKITRRLWIRRKS